MSEGSIFNSYIALIKIMKQIGTFRVKVSSTQDVKKLADGSKKIYKYGSVSLRNPNLTQYIGKEVMIRVFIE